MTKERTIVTNDNASPQTTKSKKQLKRVSKWSNISLPTTVKGDAYKLTCRLDDDDGDDDDDNNVPQLLQATT